MKNAQRLLDPGTTPPGGYHYTDPDTGYTVKSPSLKTLIEDCTKHRTANGLAIPDQFPVLIETTLCRQLPAGICVYLDGRGLGGSLCDHRSKEPVRMVVCESCGGSIRAKVFGCAIHAECSPFAKDIGVKNCLTCPDRLEPE